MKSMVAFLLVAGLLGLAKADEAKKFPRVQFRLGQRNPGVGLTEMTVAGAKEKVYLSDKIELSEKDVAEASAEKTAGRVEITLVFTEAGKEKMTRVTEANLNKVLGIVVDGRLVAAPIIRSAISGGRAAITGNFSEEEANRIVSAIRGKDAPAEPRPKS